MAGVELACLGSEFNMSKSVCLKSNEAAESRGTCWPRGSLKSPSQGFLNSLKWNRSSLCFAKIA